MSGLYTQTDEKQIKTFFRRSENENGNVVAKNVVSSMYG